MVPGRKTKKNPKPEAKRHPKTILHPFSSSVLRGGIGFAPKAALGADASGLMADRPPSAEAGVGLGIRH